MALSDGLVTKTLVNLEMFLKKAAGLDIFEALIFNYKVKMNLIDPLAVHFLAIVTELANQLQHLARETSEQKNFVESVLELGTKKLVSESEQTHESVLLSVKSEELSNEVDPVVLSVYGGYSNRHEIQMLSKDSKMVYEILPHKGYTKHLVPVRVKQESKSLVSKKNETQGKPEKVDMLSPVVQDVKSHKCNLCGSNFTSESKLNLHISKCLKDPTLLSKGQDTASTPKGKSKRSKMNKCSICDANFATRRCLTTHINHVHKAENDATAEDVSNGSCTISEDSVIGHNEGSDADLLPENLPFFYCNTCLLAYRTYKEFEVHECVNRGNNIEEGSIWRNYVQIVGRHLVTNLENLKLLKKYKCGLCHEEYRSISRMSYHLPRCTQGPYKCELCTEEYAFKKDLNLHKKKTHKGANSFFCDECGLTFKFRTSLQKHKIKRHETEQGPFTCEECGKEFSKRIQLTSHKINTHRVERKFLCQMCGNKFSNYGSLMTHLDTHTDTRKFTCTYCSKKFRQKEKLKFHTRIHTGERPHLCQTCGKGFIRKSKLDEHMRRHRGEKRYHCTKCNKSYAAGWDLKLHNKKQHPDAAEASSSGPTTHESSNVSDDKSETDPDDPAPVEKEKDLPVVPPSVQPKRAEDSAKQAKVVNLKDISSSVHFSPNNHPDSETVQNESANSLLMHSINNSLAREPTLDNANSRIVLQVNSSQLSSQSLLLNNSANNSNSKIIVQLDSSQQQQQQPAAQTSLNQTSDDANPNQYVVQLDTPQSQHTQTQIVHNGNTATNNSRILLQLDHGQSKPLPPNTVLAVADAIHLAPLVEEVNSINLSNVTAQYIQLMQPEESVSSNSTVGNNSSVPLHIQLPVSTFQVPISAISQGSGSGAYELQSLPVQGQTGLMFTSGGFNVGNITY